MMNREDWNEVKNDLDAAESVLYKWACGEITTSDAKASCEFYGFKINFRQKNIGRHTGRTDNFIEAFYVPSDMYITLEI